MFFSIKCLIFVLPNSIVLCNFNYIINICCMKYVCLDNLLDRRDIQNIGDWIFLSALSPGGLLLSMEDMNFD